MRIAHEICDEISIAFIRPLHVIQDQDHGVLCAHASEAIGKRNDGAIAVARNARATRFVRSLRDELDGQIDAPPLQYAPAHVEQARSVSTCRHRRSGERRAQQIEEHFIRRTPTGFVVVEAGIQT